MAPPTALITGASSGIGLSLTQHILSLSFYVVMADLKPSLSPLPKTLFIHTDIASWTPNAALFAKAYHRHSRLDFIALKAGVDDRNALFNSISPTPHPTIQAEDRQTETFK